MELHRACSSIFLFQLAQSACRLKKVRRDLNLQNFDHAETNPVKFHKRIFLLQLHQLFPILQGCLDNTSSGGKFSGPLLKPGINRLPDRSHVIRKTRPRFVSSNLVFNSPETISNENHLPFYADLVISVYFRWVRPLNAG